MDQLSDEELEITYRVYSENKLEGPLLALVWIEMQKRAEAKRRSQS